VVVGWDTLEAETYRHKAFPAYQSGRDFDDESRALGRKVSDEFTVPLCRTHHREIHRCGDEGSWWGNTGIDPLAAARALWLETHPLPRAEDTTEQ
jgi:hypothetical protein